MAHWETWRLWITRIGEMTHKTDIMTGTKKGASPMLAILTLQVIQYSGAGQGCRVRTP